MPYSSKLPKVSINNEIQFGKGHIAQKIDQVRKITVPKRISCINLLRVENIDTNNMKGVNVT